MCLINTEFPVFSRYKSITFITQFMILKGLCHEMNIFKAYNIKQVLSVLALTVFTILVS